MAYYFIYAIVLIFASLYSYVLQDPNITLLNHPTWTIFRDFAVNIGYHQRPASTVIYFAILVLFLALHLWGMKFDQKINPVRLSLMIAGILTLSYPFLSHDLFNYMFDAKILTFYHQNPYFHRAMDYHDDTWLRFMHWVHRTYPYGPVFLAVTVIPSFLGIGKFILHYFLIKLLFSFFYVGCVYLLNKFSKSYALFFATSPFVLIEALINSHNEIVALFFGFLGLYFLSKKDGILSTVMMVFSAAIKFMSFPFMLVATGKYYWMNYMALAAMTVVLLYGSFAVEVQQWYFLNLLFFLPIFPNLIKRLSIFFVVLPMSYYSFIMFGEWNSNTIEIKHWFILGGFVLNAIYLLIFLLRRKQGLRFLLSEALSKEEHI